MSEKISPRRTKETSTTWLTEQFRALLTQNGLEPHFEAGLELFRKRRVLDFTLTAGAVSAKVQTDSSEVFFCQILLQPLSDNSWQQVFKQLATESLYFAKLLAGIFPAEMINGFSLSGCEILPSDGTELTLKSECSDEALGFDCLAALYFRLNDALENDPFAIFTLRGRGRDETIFQIRKERNILRRQFPTISELNAGAALETQKKQLLPRLNRFWSAGAALSELSYSIKADELPAALLKWLDALPLHGLEENLDLVLEEAYANVTRRAQAYGLGLA